MTINSMQSGESQQEESEENIDITAEEAEAVINKLKSDKACYLDFGLAHPCYWVITIINIPLEARHEAVRHNLDEKHNISNIHAHN